ncbi:hypothetical protein [Cellvibrio fibrivorans]|uniref:MAE-28990/MAE-18760-like HEPN domain-containing protein n=1 Tax=Cellvibrio fibrivorans TaxID=126350 RepID=A0ABU1UYM5_9GAMM|nr:hypothetical protein [Cellvibrio fibrivorans]MDR7090287.1 hypothetical protein [Cellvibrio fibrivorans]
MFNYNPRGENLRALEQNILKFRAFEMIMILFYVEEIKLIALRTIRVTDKFSDNERLQEGTTKLYKKLWKILVSEKILTENEKLDIEAIIDYRNDIAHSTQELVFDLNLDSYSKSFVKLSGEKYQYGVLKRLKKYKDLIYERFAGGYVFEMNMNPVLFSQAERTYLIELKRLDKKIVKLLKERKIENRKIENEMKSIGRERIESLKPCHPKNFKSNGQFTSLGENCLNSLFSMGCSSIVISYLMRRPLKTINRKKKEWLKNA